MECTGLMMLGRPKYIQMALLENGKDGTLLHTGNTQIKITFMNKLRADYLYETTANIPSRIFVFPFRI
jgi:hypothetical protein